MTRIEPAYSSEADDPRGSGAVRERRCVLSEYDPDGACRMAATPVGRERAGIRAQVDTADDVDEQTGDCYYVRIEPGTGMPLTSTATPDRAYASKVPGAVLMALSGS